MCLHKIEKDEVQCVSYLDYTAEGVYFGFVVDSLTAHFRSEYTGRENLALRQQKINTHMHKLIRLARALNAVAFVTNQVMSSPDIFFGDAVRPIGGHVVGHTSHTRVYIRNLPAAL